MTGPPLRKDAIVIGSGAAGLTAALTLRLGGVEVAIVEAEELIGGTSAIGGGNLWIPCNGAMLRANLADDADRALAYLRKVSGPQPPAANARAFIDNGTRLVEFVEANSALRFASIFRPDYHPDWAGAAVGRSLEPEPFDAGVRLGDQAAWFRADPGRAPLTYVEYRAGGAALLATERRLADVRTQGAALVAGLGHACLAEGVDFLRGAAVQNVRRLPAGGFEVMLAEERRLAADAVILAAGGFAADPGLRRAFLPPVDFVSLSAGRAAGDGLRFGLDCGAGLFGIGDGWLGAVHAPDDGRPPFLVVRDLALPGSMLVNADGRRFVNEALGYNDVGRGMLAFDPARASYYCADAWLIFDSAFRASNVVLGISADQPAPAAWRQADDIAAMARLLSMSPDVLERSAAQLTGAAATGVDTLFGRAGDAHQRFNGDLRQNPNPCLGRIEQAPFYAAPIRPGLCGTKGGLAVDAHARVLDRDDQPIAGLYACGDVATTVMGYGYAGAGASLGPAMTFAMLAAEAIVGGI